MRVEFLITEAPRNLSSDKEHYSGTWDSSGVGDTEQMVEKGTRSQPRATWNQEQELHQTLHFHNLQMGMVLYL